MIGHTGLKKTSAALFLGCLIFSACSNMLESSNSPNSPNFSGYPGTYNPIPPGKGRVMVKIGDSSGARTLIPEDLPVFSKYELEFTAPGKDSFSLSISAPLDMAGLTGSGYPVDLDSAIWSLTVTAFVSYEGAYLQAANNTITLDVVDGALTLQTITVDSLPISQGGDGLFYWNLAVSDVSYTGTLTLAREGEGAALSKTFPGDTLTGTAAVAAGYYVMILELTNDANKTARRAEVVHIYPGLTTNGDFSFSGGDFVAQKYLEGTLSLSDFSGPVSAITVHAYSGAGFTQMLDSVLAVDTDGTWAWKAKVPVTHRDINFLAAITAGGKTYTLIVGTESSVGDAGRSGISLSAVYKTITAWAEIKEAIDRIPPAAAGFVPGGESVLVIGASFDIADSIVLNKPITLEADSSPRSITRGTGMTGAFFDIQSGGSLTLGETSTAVLTLDGNKGSVTAAAAMVTVNGGSLVMNDNALITNNSNNGVSVNTGSFTMSGSAQVAQNNPVYLAAGRTITLGGNLTQTTAAVIDLPASTALGAQVLEGSAYLIGNHSKFTIAGYDSDVRWVNSAGQLEFVKLLEGTLSLSAFSGGTASAITVKAYSAGFTELLYTDTAVNTGGTWTWEAKVPLTQNTIDFLATITAGGKTYTLIAGTATSSGDQAGISLAGVYTSITGWQDIKAVLDRIPPASTEGFTPADESVLVIGASFTATATSGTIVLNKAITLKADTTSDRSITRGTGMTGAFFDIQSGGSLTLGETSAVKLLTLDGNKGSVTAAAALITVNGGILIMNNNALITNNTNYGVSVNTGSFTMSGSALVAQNNPVYLAAGRTITLGGNLTQTTAAAIALPASTALGAQVLEGSAYLSGNHDKFTIDGYDSDVRWVNTAGQLEQLSLVLDGTLSLTDFSGGTVSAITVKAYSDSAFTSALDSVSAVNAGTWTWKVKVPVTQTSVDFLAIITADSKTYTLIVRTAFSVGGASQSGISLSAVYKPITTWMGLKEAIDRIPPGFTQGEESVLIVGGDVTTTTAPGTIVINKPITLKADSSNRTITRGTGMTGAFFDIQSGGSLTLSEASAVNLLTLDGNKGSVTATAALVAVNDGSLVMKDNALITNNTNNGVSVNTGSFTMSGSALVNQNNPVYLAVNQKITLGGDLTQTFAAAIALPTSTALGAQVLEGSSYLIGNHSKFTIAGYDPAVRYVDTNGQLAQREPSITCVIGYSQLSFSGAAVAVDRGATVSVTAQNATGLTLSGWTASGRDYRGARITLSNVTGATEGLTFTAPSAAGEYDITITVIVNGKIHSGNFRLRVRA
ncbi:beta strand repeat-containing protein [Treponema primitia]|uniref:beta strand repeat-containing protein n=1 Tax=Treponema primitia TaxID=88058 RepID=UPI0002E5E591|nr:hypothetical protein [Treponema primitia]